jgi:Ca2+-binding EF-hand superfamily protein
MRWDGAGVGADADGGKKSTKELAKVAPAKKSMVAGALKSVVSGVTTFAKSPVATTKYGWAQVKEVAQHYYIGSKLLWQEIKLARAIFGRMLAGHAMTRRERMQLIRTAMDVFRVVPLTIFVVIPFMEFLLPFALKAFPNMLPSTFQDTLKKEENMKKELSVRLDIAAFMQETLTTMAEKKKKKKGDDTDAPCSATEIIEFIEQARGGDGISNEQVLKMARFFEDELTLANVGRPQLVSMCKYMGLSPYGADGFLRFQMRAKLRAIKEDDQSIVWEGIDSLNDWEIRDACQERGMRATGLSKFAYKRQLQDWLDLSMHKSVPISLLVLSRAFSIANIEKPESQTDGIKSSISGLDEELLNEVVLAAARDEDEDNIEIKLRRLESLEYQNEMIEEERAEKSARDAQKAEDAKKTKAEGKAAAAAAAAAAATEGGSTKSESNVGHSPMETDSEATGWKDDSDEEAKSSEEDEDEDSETGELSLAELEALGDLVRESSVEREKTKLQEIKAKAILSSSSEEEDSETAEALKEMLPPVKEKAMEAETFPAEEPFVETIAPGVGHTGTSSAPIDVEVAEATTDKEYDTKEIVTEEQEQEVEEEEEEVPDLGLSRMQSVVQSMVSRLEEDIEKTDNELGDALRLLDLDRDGSMSVEELKSTMKTVLKRNLPDTESETIIKAMDKDGDGKISVEELLMWIEETKEINRSSKKDNDSDSN